MQKTALTMPFPSRFASFLTICLLSMPLLVYSDTATLNIIYKDDIKEEHYKYVDLLKEDQTLQELLVLVQDSIRLNQSVDVLIGADDGPLYDPETNEIWIPTGFFEEIDRRFTEAELTEQPDDASQAVLDVTLHTLIHEIGHAFIAQHNIPTLGKEEDAVDNLATVFLLEYFDDGDLIALNAANMFALEDGEVETWEDEDFWSEHSLDIQRYFSTICHVYGSRPEDNRDLINNGELSAERGEQCLSEYELVNHDWHRVLESVKFQNDD